MIRSALFATLAGFLVCVSPAMAADPIPWRTDYLAARKEAEEKKLPMLVVIGSQDCVYCRKMEAGTFTDPNTVAFVNAKFIPLKIDATANPEFARAMKVTVYPTTVLAGSDGRVHGFLAGYLAVDQFRDNANKALAAMPPAAPPEVAFAPIAPTKPLVNKPQPPTARELFALAKEAYVTERFGECLERCESLISTHPETPESKAAAGLLKQVHADAEKLALASDQLDERYAASYFALGQAWQSKGKVREAIANYEKAIRLAPNVKFADAVQAKLSALIRDNPAMRTEADYRR